MLFLALDIFLLKTYLLEFRQNHGFAICNKNVAAHFFRFLIDLS